MKVKTRSTRKKMPLLQDPSLSGLLIARKNVITRSAAGTASGLCEVWLNFAQKPFLLIQFSDRLQYGIPNANSDLVNDINLIFDGTIKPTKCEIYGQRIGSDGSVTTQLWPKRGIFFGNDGEFQKAEVLLANFGDYHFNGGSVCFEDEIFQWQLAPLSEDERERFEPCETQDFHVTHSALLRRRDRKSIQIGEAEEQVENLRLFLSYCQGGWVSPICVQGFSKDNIQIFEHWHDSLLSNYQSNSRSWLDSFDGMSIADAWPGFISLCRDPLWKESIKLSFYWFLRGDSGQVGSDGGLILLQAAFERLAWHLFVIDDKKLSAAKFKKTQASEN